MTRLNRQFVGWSVLFPVLLGLTAGVALAADPFGDLPATHWAYKDIRQLVDRGILDGYPDGTFRGKNLVTRYALAVTLARALQQLEAGGSPTATAPRGAKLQGQDLETLERLIKEFSEELSMLGVRVASTEEKLKLQEKELDGVKSRVEALEKGDADGAAKRIWFESGEMLLRGHNKEELSNSAGAILNMDFKVEDKVQGRVGLQYDNHFDQFLDDQVGTYEAYADFFKLGPFDRFRAGKYNVFLGPGLTLFDRREGFLLNTERNDVRFQVGYFDAQLYSVETTLLGDAAVGFYYIQQDTVAGQAPRHMGVYAQGTAGDAVGYQFELVDYDHDGRTIAGGTSGQNENQNTQALQVSLRYKDPKRPQSFMLGYVAAEEDFRALAVDGDLRYHNEKHVLLEDVLQALRDATSPWLDKNDIAGFCDFKLEAALPIGGTRWRGRAALDLLRDHTSARYNGASEFDLLTLAVERNLGKDAVLELRLQSLMFDHEDSAAQVDTFPSLHREDNTTLRAQFFVKF